MCHNAVALLTVLKDEDAHMDDRSNRDGNWTSADALEKGDTFTIGDLASEFDVTTRTIRFYEAKGLITPTRVRGARIYSKRERARLILILRGKRVGYKLDDIRAYLDLYETDPTQLTQLQFVQGKMAASIAELEQKERDIRASLEELREMKAAVDERIRTRTGQD